MSATSKVDCPHASSCGGCALIEHTLDQQLTLKGERLGRAVEGYAALRSIPRTPVVAATPISGYRTRTKLMVDAAGAIGLYAPGSHTVIDIPECRVMPTLMNTTVNALRPLLAGSGIEAIDVRQTQDGDHEALLVTLIAGTASVERARSLAEEVGRLPNVASVAVSTRARGAVQLLGRDLTVIHGPRHVVDRMHADSPFVHASHGAFVQAHRQQAHALQSHVIDLLRGSLGDLSHARIAELHCGEGALGLRLAKLGAAMLLVDSFEPAIQRVREAAESQHLQVEAWAHDATDAVTRLLEDKQTIHAVLLDPPRRGLPALLRRSLAALTPKAIVYVSCGPESFARDLSHFAFLGYAPSKITPFDLIPLSEEVESVALLIPSAMPKLSVIYEDAQVVIVDKPPHLPTTPQGEHVTSLLSIARAQFNAPQLTAIHRLDSGTSGVCILAKEAQHVHAWSQALAAGDKRYRALVRGIIRGKGTIKRALRDGPRMLDARTRYSRDEVIGGHSLITAMPDEGRTHQIRRHLESLNHPILGDSRYGDPKSNRYFEHKHGLDRTFLHCATITLVAPTTATEITFSAPLAADLNAVLTSMRA